MYMPMKTHTTHSLRPNYCNNTTCHLLTLMHCIVVSINDIMFTLTLLSLNVYITSYISMLYIVLLGIAKVARPYKTIQCAYVLSIFAYSLLYTTIIYLTIISIHYTSVHVILTHICHTSV